jgi:hypothetical protein
VARRKYPKVECKPVSERMLVYRFVARRTMDRDVLAEELMTDAEAEAPEDGRERKYATLREARSVFAPKSAALRRWRKAKRSAEREGEVMRDRYIAVLEIGREDGLCIEQRGNDGHMLLWGEKNQLAAKVVRVFDGDDEQENQGEE